MITSFSKGLLNTTEYVVNPEVSPTTSIAPRAPRISRGSQNLSASELTARRRNVGVSNTVFDLNFLDSTLDLGVLSSNGFRYNYIAFKADVDPNCSIIESNKSVPVTEETAAGDFIIDQEILGGKIIRAYAGNSVAVPFARPNNGIATPCSPQLKFTRVVVNNNCP